MAQVDGSIDTSYGVGTPTTQGGTPTVSGGYPLISDPNMGMGLYGGVGGYDPNAFGGQTPQATFAPQQTQFDASQLGGYSAGQDGGQQQGGQQPTGMNQPAADRSQNLAEQQNIARLQQPPGQQQQRQQGFGLESLARQQPQQGGRLDLSRAFGQADQTPGLTPAQQRTMMQGHPIQPQQQPAAPVSGDQAATFNERWGGLPSGTGQANPLSALTQPQQQQPAPQQPLTGGAQPGATPVQTTRVQQQAQPTPQQTAPAAGRTAQPQARTPMERMSAQAAGMLHQMGIPSPLAEIIAGFLGQMVGGGQRGRGGFPGGMPFGGGRFRRGRGGRFGGRPFQGFNWRGRGGGGGFPGLPGIAQQFMQGAGDQQQGTDENDNPVQQPDQQAPVDQQPPAQQQDTSAAPSPGQNDSGAQQQPAAGSWETWNRQTGQPAGAVPYIQRNRQGAPGAATGVQPAGLTPPGQQLPGVQAGQGFQPMAAQGGQQQPGQITAPLSNFVRTQEGFSNRAYPDGRQYSIGYGTKANSPNEVIDRNEAERRLQTELGHAQRYVSAVLPQNAPQNVRDALTSFTYNVGPGWTRNSRLAQAVRSGDYRSAAQIMQSYNHAGGVINAALVRRRRQEAAMLLGQTQTAQL